MLKLKDIPPEEMPDVVRVAQRLYQQDQVQIERAQEQRQIVEAAEEVGLPEEYLERAAAELHRERVEKVYEKRKQRKTAGALLAAAGFAAAIGIIFAARSTRAIQEQHITIRVLAQPITEAFDASAASRWTVNQNPESKATVGFENYAGRQAVVIRVERFGVPANGRFFVNLDSLNPPASLLGRRTVSFDARGKGLPFVRLYMENGPTERWRSPNLRVPADWAPVTVRLDQFDYQNRPSASVQWKVQRYRPPESVQRLSFKAGDFVNKASDAGEVGVSNFRVE